jgi:hypothetical protein
MICGEWNVDKLLHQMPAHLAVEWQTFLALEPHGALADDLRSAQVCALLANINAPKGRSYKIQDFVVNTYIPPKKQTAEEMFALLEGMFPNGKKH